jgi:hypothetical protein
MGKREERVLGACIPPHTEKSRYSSETRDIWENPGNYGKSGESVENPGDFGLPRPAPKKLTP